jgi:prepilin-type N-terminal cleavage/methylation domain-containing protein
MKKRKGFTLIELIAAIAILSIAMVGISNAIYSGTKISAKNTKKVNTNVFAQYVIQTYKSQGKKYLQTTYGCTTSPFKGYFYFDKIEDIDSIISDPLNFTTGISTDIFTDMKNGIVASNKSFGAYVEISTSQNLGKDHLNPTLNVSCIYDTVRISVQIVSSKDMENNGSSLVFFVGR